MLFLDVYLPETAIVVKDSKIIRTVKGCGCLVESGQRVIVKFRYRIKSPKVYAKSVLRLSIETAFRH